MDVVVIETSSLGDRSYVVHDGSVAGSTTARRSATARNIASARRIVEESDADAELYPTQGFGSFCASGPATATTRSTVAEQRRINQALTDPDEAHFVRELIAHLTAYPSYYAQMGPANLTGPAPVDLRVPVPLEAPELQRRLERGQWVVDLSRIGIDSPAAAIGSEPSEIAPHASTSSYPRVTWDGFLTRHADGETILEVRRVDEFEESQVVGAINIPLHEVLVRTEEIPNGPVWVHCAAGYRAGIAASLMQRAGKDPRHIDAAFCEASSAGVPLASTPTDRTRKCAEP